MRSFLITVSLLICLLTGVAAAPAPNALDRIYEQGRKAAAGSTESGTITSGGNLYGLNPFMICDSN